MQPIAYADESGQDPASAALISLGLEVGRVTSTPHYLATQSQAAQVLALAPQEPLIDVLEFVSSAQLAGSPSPTVALANMTAAWSHLKPGDSWTATSGEPGFVQAWETLLASADFQAVRGDMLALLDAEVTRAALSLAGYRALLLLPGEGILGTISGLANDFQGAVVDTVVGAGKVIAGATKFVGGVLLTLTAASACAALGAPVGGLPAAALAAIACGVGAVLTGTGRLITGGVQDIIDANIEYYSSLLNRLATAQGRVSTYILIKMAKTAACVYFGQLYAEDPTFAPGQQAVTDSCTRAITY